MLAANDAFLCIIKRKCYFGTCNEKETCRATKDPPPTVNVKTVICESSLHSSIGLNFVAKNHSKTLNDWNDINKSSKFTVKSY